MLVREDKWGDSGPGELPHHDPLNSGEQGLCLSISSVPGIQEMLNTCT